MNSSIERIQSATAAIRAQIVNHPSYNTIQNLADVKTFMEYHIYAVWDFMSLLKSLQRQLTCTDVPWVPVGAPQVRYLINEIVCGEESDVAYGKNGHASHFELYLEAMAQSGASRTGIAELLSLLESGKPIDQAIEIATIPAHAKDFLRFTFEVIATRQPHIIAAVFTFGREDLIPNMFHTIVSDLNERFPDQIDIFKYYLDRHIEVDGEHHSHLALEMVTELCGNDAKKWEEAETYVLRALESRSHLWDGVALAIKGATPTS